MSRTLSKILVICAMIAVIPLMIVGTAFAAYYSINANMEVTVYCNDTSLSEDAFAKVVFNDKADAQHKITMGHKSKVNLKAVTNGYDFKGWFAGDLKAYATAHTSGNVEFAHTETEINVNIAEYEKILAVFEIKEYEVTYSYKANPTDTDLDIIYTTPETDDGDATSRVYSYGDVLPTLAYEGFDYKFLGWKIVDDESNNIYTSATFDFNSAITLTSVWQAQNKINVNYYLSKTDTTPLKTVQIYENELYTLEEVSAVVNAETIKNGYVYSWQDKDGNIVSSVNSSVNYDVYLKTDAIVYTANLNFENAEDTTFEGTSSVEFSIENMGSLNPYFDFTKYGTKYSFYDIEGLEYSGVTYKTVNEIPTLVAKIINDNPNGAESPITFNVVLQKNFATFKVAGNISFKAALDDSTSYLENVYKQADISGDSPWSVSSREVDSTVSINGFLNLLNGTEEVKLYIRDGREVKLTKLVFSIGDMKYTILITPEIKTMNDVIETLLSKPNFDMTPSAIFEVASIEAQYNVVA